MHCRHIRKLMQISLPSFKILSLTYFQHSLRVTPSNQFDLKYFIYHCHHSLNTWHLKIVHSLVVRSTRRFTSEIRISIENANSTRLLKMEIAKVTTVFKRNVTHNVQRLELSWSIIVSTPSFRRMTHPEVIYCKAYSRTSQKSKWKTNTVPKKKNTNTNTRKDNRSEHLYFTYCETQHSYFNTSQAIFFYNLWAFVLQKFHSSS